MVNSISVVLFIVLLAVAAFSAAMGSYYYSTLSESLKQKAENAISSFDYYRTEAEYYDNARAVVAGEPNSDKLEVEYLDADGQIRFSSSDLTAFRSPGTPDIAEAISMKRTKVWIGADPSTGEHIMAASSPLMIDGEVVGVMRYVTSLNKVDKQIIIIVAIALGIGLGILGMVYFSNLYFIRSIVDPVAGITETAKRIAAGSYGVQIEKRYDDEIGALTDTINDMSLKINQSEKMKNEFISSVSHELRTPLTAINGWAETIMNGEVFEIIGYTVFLQYRFYDGEEAVRTLDGEHGGGVHIGERHLFTVHAFTMIVARQINFLSGKGDFIRYGRGGDTIGNFGFNGLLFRVYRAVPKQKWKCGTGA